MQSSKPPDVSKKSNKEKVESTQSDETLKTADGKGVNVEGTSLVEEETQSLVSKKSNGNGTSVKGMMKEYTPPSNSGLKQRKKKSISTSQKTNLEPTTMPSLPMQKMNKVINVADLMKDRYNYEVTAHSRTPEKDWLEQGPAPAPCCQTMGYTPAVINQEEFDKRFGFKRVDLSLSSRIYNTFVEAKHWGWRQWLNFVRNYFPLTQWLTEYNWKKAFIMDVIGGLMMAVMSIPQGLAYGYMVGLKPTHGLYTGIVGPLVYAVLGTSRHASPGAFAIVALMVGSAVQQASKDYHAQSHTAADHINASKVFCCAPATGHANLPYEHVLQLVAGLTVLVGIIQIAFGFLNAGLLAVWMSDHLVQGLTSGAAIHVLTSQIKSMTGVENVPKTSDVAGIVKFYICFVRNFTTVKTDHVIASFIVCLTLILSKQFFDPVFGKWMKIKFPMEFFVVVGGTFLCYTSVDTDYKLNLAIVGEVERGMMSPFAIDMHLAQPMIGSAISIAVISFVIHVALAKLVSKKEKYQINANQEWFALGMMHLISAFFGCFAGGSSLSRTMTSVKMGTCSQMSTVVCALVLVLIVYLAADLLYYLPKPVLACIVVVALKDLFVQIYDAVKLIKKSCHDFMIWFVTFVAVILLNVNWGLMIGVAFALLTVIFRSQWAESTCLGNIPGTPDYKGLDHYREASEVPGVRVYRFDAPLYFANAELFLSRLHTALGINPIMALSKLHAEKSKRHTETPGTPDVRRLTPKVDDELNEGSIQLNVKPTYANAKEITSAEAEEEKKSADLKPDEYIHLSHFVIDCSSFPYIDLMGMDVLIQAYTDLHNMGIRVFFCNCKVSVRQFFEQNDFYKRVPKTHLYCSVFTAVTQAQLERERYEQKKKDNFNSLLREMTAIE